LDGLRLRDAPLDEAKCNYLEQLGRSMSWWRWDLAMSLSKDLAGMLQESARAKGWWHVLAVKDDGRKLRE
jgi:hypothetical protein